MIDIQDLRKNRELHKELSKLRTELTKLEFELIAPFSFIPCFITFQSHSASETQVEYLYTTLYDFYDAMHKLQLKEKEFAELYEAMLVEISPTAYMVNIDNKVVGGESAMLVFTFDNDKAVYTTHLLIDHETIAIVESVRPFWDGNENSEMENELYEIVKEKYNVTTETVFEMFTEFRKAGAKLVEKIRRLKPQRS